MTIGEGM
jgi:hypothetical protein